jgi:hypothetical protein
LVVRLAAPARSEEVTPGVQWHGTPDGKHVYLSAQSSLWKVEETRTFSRTQAVVNVSALVPTVLCTNGFLYSYAQNVLNAYPISANGDLGPGVPNVAGALSVTENWAVSPDDRCVVFCRGANVTVGCRNNTVQSFQLSANKLIAQPFKVDDFTPFAVSDDVVYVFSYADDGFRLGVWSLSTLELLQCFSSDAQPENCTRLPQILAPLAPVSGKIGDSNTNADIQVKEGFLVVSQFYVYTGGSAFVLNFVFRIESRGLLSIGEQFCFTAVAGTTCAVLPGEFNSKWFFSRDMKSIYALGTTGFPSALGNLPKTGTAVVQGLFSANGEVDTVPAPFGCVGLLSSSPDALPCNQTLPAGAGSGSLYFYRPGYLLVTDKFVYFLNMWLLRV